MVEAASQLTRSVARLATSTADYMGARLEQLDSALRAERRRWFWMLFATGAMLLWLGVASVFAGAAIVLAFRESGALASALVGAGFALLAVACAALLWHCTRRQSSVTDRLARILALVLESRSHGR
jgi:apolipoprotein N-acyltransferase